MAWPEARDQVVAIIEATTPTTLKGGLGGKFRYEKKASRLAVPDSRGFWFGMHERVAMHGQTTPVLPRRTRLAVPLIFAYRDDIEPARRMEAMLADYDAIVRRLMDSGNWASSTSTIENLSASEEDLAEAITEPVEGAVLQIFNLLIEFRTS
jgi:hypothetical protein